MTTSHSIRTTGSLLVLLLASLFAWSCTSANKTTADEAQATTEVVKEIPVVVEPVVFDNFSLTKTYSGTFEGDRQANIVAKVSEIVEAIPVKIGDSVKKGQVVVRLDRQGPSSRYHQAESSYRNAERTRNRMKALFNAGAVSKQSLDDAQTAYEVASAEFEAARSLVDITTPIDGTVTAIELNVGDVTSPAMPVVTVADVARMKIVFHAGEADLRFLTEGLPIKVYSELRPELKIDGELFQIAKSASISTRTFEVKAVFDNTEDLWFRPGMFGITEVTYTTSDPVLAVPKTAVVREAGSGAVFVVRGDRVSRKSVQLGVSSESHIAVTGLAVGDSVVTMGVNQIEDGSIITPVDAEQFAIRGNETMDGDSQ